MHHLIAFTGTQPIGATLAKLPALQDQVVPINSSNNFIMPQDFDVLAAYVQGPAVVNAQLATPSLRTVVLPFLQPVEAAGAPPDKPNVIYYYGNSPTLPRLDELQLNTSNVNAGTDLEFALIWLSDRNQQLQSGRIYTALATAANTTANKVWTNSTIAFNQTLPGGRYMIVGMDVIGANLLAARLVLPGLNLRPGCLARTAYTNTPSPLFRSGALGNYGWFDSIAPPTIDFLGTAAPTAQDIFLDLIKIG